MKKGIKHDQEKPRWDLLPLSAVEELVKVMTYGAGKYKPNNWQHVKPHSRYFAACLRHLTAHQAGELLDPETQLSHLAHAATNLIFLLYFEKNKK